VSADDRPLEVRVVEALQRAGWTVTTAESLTGGRLAARITAVPGASQVYLGGLVTYATTLKTSLLGVPAELVATYGVVSAECARAMAEGARGATGAGYALSTTGVAGPDSQEGRAPGTVFIGLAGSEGASGWELALTGDRGAVQEATCDAALDALRHVLTPEGGALR